MNATDAIELLRRMVQTPSVSRSEDAVADLIESYLRDGLGWDVRRCHNNLWCVHADYDPGRPTLLLNSHIDTVKPTPAYTRDPFDAEIVDGKLYGLGSNDAGASVVSLIASFDAMRSRHLSYNQVIGITAEEEVMGERGMRAFLPMLVEEGITPDMALVGEPTGMNAAVGERGLVVLDCVARGRQGHAARDFGDTSILKAVRDIERINGYRFERRSELLGDIKMTVTQIEAGHQHNVIPSECRFVVDIRTTDAYTNEEVVEIMQQLLESEARERSTRVRPSAIYAEHPLVRAAKAIGRETFVSPTTSDMAVMPFASLKMGPGESPRSHQPDEFIMLDEISQGIEIYTQLLTQLDNETLG